MINISGMYMFYPHLDRKKCLLTSGFSKYIVDPDKNLAYDIVQSYVDDRLPKVTSPTFDNWKETLSDIPQKVNYTHV